MRTIWIVTSIERNQKEPEHWVIGAYNTLKKSIKVIMELPCPPRAGWLSRRRQGFGQAEPCPPRAGTALSGASLFWQFHCQKQPCLLRSRLYWKLRFQVLVKKDID